MNKFIAAGLVSGAVVALLGLAYIRFFALDVDCGKHRHHCIRVSVDSGNVHVDAPKLRKKGPNHKIWWIVDKEDSETYAFQEDGIVFETAEGKAEFSCRKVSPRVFSCDDPRGNQATMHKDGFK